MSDTTDRSIIEHILESEEFFPAACECSRVFPQVAAEVIRRREIIMRAAIAARPELHSFSCRAEVNLGEPYQAPLECFCPAGKGVHLTLGIEAQARPLRSMIIGIHWDFGHKNESPELAQKLFSFFNEHFRRGKTCEWWPWYIELSVPWNNWESKQALQALYNTELTDPENDMLVLCMLFERFLTTLAQKNMNPIIR